ncbi:MAG TPA: efflux RND transporter periplasmic adaptor subunit [Acetobacteraceae bacterium]|jgi:membrane fusion protein, multidrug efflux system|nr:efflux RND transporter periplasmic adaptor subunit [Acetobacteraceae bacterium]
MAKRMIIMLIAAAIVLGGVFGFQVFKAHMIKQVMAKFANPPQTVSTITAGNQDWQPHLSAVGTLRAENGANLSLQLSGIVDQLDFKSGDDVQKGQVLLRLRNDDDVAKLQSLQANAELARINYDRDRKQLLIHAVAQATVDSDVATLKNDDALVAQQQAIVDQKILHAPFAGHLGIRAVDLGQYLTAGTTVVTLQALDPLFVDFYLPQQALANLKVGQSVALQVDTWPDQTFNGKISAINPQVDSTSRNVQVRAELPNPDHRLLPGMFATLQIETGAPQRFVTLPDTAVAYNPYGSTVYIVVDKGKGADGQPNLIAQQSFVTTGDTRGDQVAILKGVNPGDKVVTAGQIKLHNGSPVAINNSVQPLDNPHPQVSEQ